MGSCVHEASYYLFLVVLFSASEIQFDTVHFQIAIYKCTVVLRTGSIWEPSNRINFYRPDLENWTTLLIKVKIALVISTSLYFDNKIVWTWVEPVKYIMVIT